MKRLGRTALTGLLMVFSGFAAFAVPAKQGVFTLTQSDGTEIHVKLVGDERNHQYFTADGYLLAYDNGNYCYATVAADGTAASSGIAARNAGVRSAAERNFLAAIDRDAALTALDAALDARRAAAGPERGVGLFPETRFPGMGEQKALVIIVEYKDVKFSTPEPYDYFNRLLNEEGFSLYGGTGSARDFFIESSMGQFVPTFDLFGPVTLPQNMSYYGGNGWSGDDQNPQMMVVHACQALDDQIDFTEYDRDGDGEVDNVFIFYAGRGEASGGGADTVWPHSWTLSSAGSDLVLDGVRINRYACSNEWEGSRPDGVGTFVHEFSHVMGLPDLYATRYTSSFTPGAWSAMDYGPYNNGGCTPPRYSAYERYALDWITPAVIDGAMNATLPPIEENVCGIIPTGDPEEFFLVENRQNNGWDAYIPGHGMLVWHIDYDTYTWQRNEVNNTPSHQYVDIEEADGTQSDYSRDGDSFPGASNVTSFTDNTRPGMKTWAGRSLNLPITDIAENNGIITFKVCGGRDDLPAPVVAITESTPESLTLGWDAAALASGGTAPDVYGSLYTLTEAVPGAEQEMTYVFRNRSFGNTGTYVIDGLEPQTAYYLTAYTNVGLQSSAVSEPVEGFTGRPGLDRLRVETLAAENVDEDSFVARWNLLPEAEEYILNVYETVFGLPYSDGLGFDDGTELLPEGWFSNTGAGYLNTAYSGKAIPALRLGKSGEYVSTPEYADGIRGFSFWQRGNSNAGGDVLKVQALVAGSWTTVGEAAVVTTKGGTISSFGQELIPEGTTAMRVLYQRMDRGSVAIDDIEVLHGITYGYEPVAEYTEYPAGSGDNCLVTGLKPETEYSYTVTGTAGELRSLPGERILLETKKSSGISDAGVETTVSIRTYGRTIAVAGLAPGEHATVTDLAGRTVATLGADGVVAVGAPGLYIVKAGSTVRKTVLR